MSDAAFTEIQLKNAVALYAQALRMTEPSDVPEPVFSVGFKDRCRQNSALAAGLLKDKKRAARRRAFRSAAAVFVILLLSFAALMAFSTPVRAAVIRWYTEVRDKVVQIRFNHSEDDHAFIICTPGDLPGGFECIETTHFGQYCRKIYKNPETGHFIRFEYMKPTEKQKADIEKTAQNAEQYLVFEYYKMYLTKTRGTYKLCWYDPDRELVFYVRSDLDKDILVRTFSTIDFRLPLYEPVWLPEGFEEYDRTEDYPSINIHYSDNNGRQLHYEVTDRYVTDIVQISKGLGLNSDEVLQETVTVRGMMGYYYPQTMHDNSSDMVLIDEKNDLVFILTGTIEKSELIQIAENIKCLENDW